MFFIMTSSIFLLFARGRCWGPAGLLDDQRPVQASSSDHHGAVPPTTAEALWGCHGHNGGCPVDWSGPAYCPSDGQHQPSATGDWSTPWLHNQRTPGRGTLCGLRSSVLDRYEAFYLWDWEGHSTWYQRIRWWWSNHFAQIESSRKQELRRLYCCCNVG